MIEYRIARRFFVVGLLILLSAPLVADRAPIVAGVVIEPGDPASAVVARLVTDAVIVRLQARGFRVDATDVHVEFSGFATVTGNEVRVELSIAGSALVDETVDVGAPDPVAGVLPVDINLDRAVAQLVDILLESAAPFLSAIADTQEQVVRDPGELDVPDPPTGPIPGSGPTPHDVLTGAPIRRLHAGLTVGFSPAVPTLDAARYVGPSVGASMVVVWFPGGNERFAVGVTGRYVTAQVTGVAASGPLTIVPFGVSVAAASGASVSPYGRFSGGMALFVSDHPVLGQVQSLLPWAAAELGIRVSFGLFRVEVGAGAEGYLDGETLLVAFVPAIAAGVVF